MRKRWLGLAVLALSTVTGLAQRPPDAPTMMDLMRAMQFAEMVRAAALSREQLSALAGLQERWLSGQETPGPLQEAVLDLCLQVLQGKPTDELMNGPDGVGQELRQAQEQFQRASQTLAVELRETLKPEQRRALLAHESPERMLTGMVQALRQMRKAPQPDWEQARRGLSEAMAGFGGPRGAAAVPPAKIGEWLDQVRQMPDAEFDKTAPDLPGEWARALAPEMMRQIDDPGMQEQRLLEACRRLVAEPAGHELLARLLAGPPAGAPPAAAAPVPPPGAVGVPAPGK